MAAVETRDPHRLLILVEIQMVMTAMTVIVPQIVKAQIGSQERPFVGRHAGGE